MLPSMATLQVCAVCGSVSMLASCCLFSKHHHITIYNFIQFLWCLSKPWISFYVLKTGHKGSKPSHDQNQEVACSTKKTFLCNSYFPHWIHLYRAGDSGSIFKHDKKKSSTIYDNILSINGSYKCTTLGETNSSDCHRLGLHLSFGSSGQTPFRWRGAAACPLVDKCCRLLKNEDIRHHELNIRNNWITGRKTRTSCDTFCLTCPEFHIYKLHTSKTSSQTNATSMHTLHI